MKTLSNFNEAKAKEKLDIQSDTINYISVSDLKKYLNVTEKFLSQEGKSIINWLIDNNSDYMVKFGKYNSDNALAGFYDAGVPSDPALKNLYKWIGTVNRNNRLLEIPVFLTDEQFTDIISKKISPDEIILDLTSDRGRAQVVRKYTPLVHKIAKSFYGKVNLTSEEIVSAAMEGLVNAMNSYGKSSKQTKIEDIDDEETQNNIKSYTFLSYAGFMIRYSILNDVKNVSKLVRIPISAQNKERKTQGYNTKENTVSGDKVVKHNDEGSKTLFDYVGGSEDSTKGTDYEDLDKLWNEVREILYKEFDKKIIDIFTSYYGIWGAEKMKNKEIAKKYNVVPGNITYYLKKVTHFLLTDPKVKSKMQDVRELMAECRHDWDQEEDTEATILSMNENTDNDD